MSLELGLNYLPMAESALNSFDYWLAQIRLDKLKPYFSQVLSKFDNYLQLNKLGSSQTDELPVQEKIFLLKQSPYKGRGRRKIPVKLPAARRLPGANQHQPADQGERVRAPTRHRHLHDRPQCDRPGRYCCCCC